LIVGLRQPMADSPSPPLPREELDEAHRDPCCGPD
jgi:hypothetical protein